MSKVCYDIERFKGKLPDQKLFPYEKSEKLKEIQRELKDLFAVFNKIVRKYRLTYCLDSGTLLGAVRHHNIIPWDDDIDVQMSREDISVLRKNKAELNKLGYTITYNDKIYRFKRNLKGKIPYIDIFEVDDFDNKIKYSNERNREIWPKYWFKHDEKYPLKLYKFGRMSVFGPNNPYPYLERAYGEWNKGVVWNTHHTI